MLNFIKKHRKAFLVGLAVILSFVSGLLARIPRRPDIPSIGPNTPSASRHEATDQINSQRIAENSGKASGQLAGIADDNRRASDENNVIADDNRRLSDLAAKLDKLASGGRD